jgi:hypothetical protein
MARRGDRYRDSCCVVDPFCLAPANLEECCKPRLRASCFRCGMPVCVNCSSIRAYAHAPGGKARLCNDCQEEEDGSDRVVMARLHRMARR